MEGSSAGPPGGATIEVAGLSVHTHHGVTEAEREVGQRLVLDVILELARCEARTSDRLDETVDYGEVARLVADEATAHSHRTLERLCHLICERLADAYGCESVTVRAAKPEPPLPLTVDEVAVEVSWERGSAAGPRP